MKPAELSEAINQSGILTKLVQLIKNNQTKSYHHFFIKMIQDYIKSDSGNVIKLDSNLWNENNLGKVSDKVKYYQIPYGGALPMSSSSGERKLVGD